MRSRTLRRVYRLGRARNRVAVATGRERISAKQRGARRTMCPMIDFGLADATLARFVLERGIAAIYVVAFVVAYHQFPTLSGERGLEPAPRFLEVVPRFLDAPTLFRWI